MYFSVIWKENGKEKAEEVQLQCDYGIHGKGRREEPRPSEGVNNCPLISAFQNNSTGAGYTLFNAVMQLDKKQIRSSTVTVRKLRSTQIPYLTSFNIFTPDISE
jgi:hypothetical protein